jgi:hypothetical protein
LSPSAGSGVVVSELRFAALLPSGVTINSGSNFYESQAVVSQFFICSRGAYHAAGFLALKFQVDGEIHYGWALVQIEAAFAETTGGLRTTLVGFAYETVPGQGLNTGQKSGADEVSSIQADHNSDLSESQPVREAAPLWKQETGSSRGGPDLVICAAERSTHERRRRREI